MAHSRRRRLRREATDSGWLEVWREGDRLSLWFDDDVLQTEIDLGDPTRLPNPANRAMLAHLMFGQEPQRVLLAGCGGGGIARWFAARAPQVRGVAVERSAQVVQIARDCFRFPPPAQNWTLAQGDVRDWLAEHSPTLDFILVDIAESGFSPDWISATAFLRHCRGALNHGGVLTVNLLPRGAEDFAARLSRIRRVFARRILCLSVPEHDNVLVFAFRSPPELEALEQRLPERQIRWGLEFDQMLARMRRENPSGSGIF
jgi:spermidine synthase